MQSWVPVLVLLSSGCASTVYRLEGEPRTPGGPARTPCESADWLVVAPTRAEVVDPKVGTSHPENGLGLYKVGSADPVDIPSLDRVPENAILSRKRDEVAPYDRRGIIAASLGGAGVVAIAVGTVMFVNALSRTHRVLQSTGRYADESDIDGTGAGIGAGLVGFGFALGISGLVVNPTHAERTRASASRYVFLDPPDRPEDVDGLVEQHNRAVRGACPAH